MENNCQKTKWALIFSSILSEPLIFFYALLVPIFMKELHATPLQVAVLTTLHPLITFVSLYWSSFAAKDPQKTKRFILLGGFISRALWLGILFTNNVWIITAIAALYVLFSKGTTPLWSEVLRAKLEVNQRHRLFSIASTFAYIVALVLIVTVGEKMSQNGSLWKMAFVLSAFIGMLSLFFQSRIPVSPSIQKPTKFNLFTPWNEIIKVLKKDRRFLFFQMRFMLFGIGVMMLHPVMNFYFVSILQLNYVEIGFLISICKGIGSAASSRYWGKLLNSVKMPRFSSIIFALFSLLIFLSALAPIHIAFLFIAYLIRGAAQAGVHMVWNLSGPYYSGGNNSTVYSGINLIMVGARGLFAPGIGIALAASFGTGFVLFLASFLCILSTFIFTKSETTSLQEKEKMA